MQSIAVTDLHGNLRLYELTLRIAETWRIASVFITGDLAPSSVYRTTNAGDAVAVQRQFFERELFPLLESFFLRRRHCHIYTIMGNDDRRANEDLLRDFDRSSANFHLVNNTLVELEEARKMRSFFPGDDLPLYVAGYPYVPPGGALVMDWVKYENRVRLCPPDMDPCSDIYEVGVLSVSSPPTTTMADDLSDFPAFLRTCGAPAAWDYDPSRTVHLFHAPPYNTPLDWVAPRGRYEFLRLPDHVGSMEIRRFVERMQPHLVLCGHCHESVVFGDYKTDIGQSRCANPGSQAQTDVLSVIQFNVYRPDDMRQYFIHADQA